MPNASSGDWLFGIEHNNPTSLAARAKLMRHSAEILWASHRAGVTEALATANSDAYLLHHEAWRIAAFLDALAIELMAKSIIAKRGGNPVASSHMISKMVEEIDPALAVEFQDILLPLDQTSIWAGRYPTPKDAKHFMRKKIDATGTEHETFGGIKPNELAKVLGLYERLCSLA